MWGSVCSRSGVLVMLLLIQSGSGAILGSYSELVGKHIVIVSSLTMLVGAGGNASNQAAVAMIRRLALDPGLSWAKGMGCVGREAMIGAGLAGILCVLGGVRTALSLGCDLSAVVPNAVAVWGEAGESGWGSVAGRVLGVAPVDGVSVGAISLSLGVIVFVSVVLGSLFPLLLHGVGLDPAHAGPIVQVVMDILGVYTTCVVCHTLLSPYSSIST